MKDPYNTNKGGGLGGEQIPTTPELQKAYRAGYQAGWMAGKHGYGKGTTKREDVKSRQLAWAKRYKARMGQTL